MDKKANPKIFLQLQSEGYIEQSNIFKTEDDFCLIYKSIANILSAKDILDFLDSSGERLYCDRFF